MTAKMVRSLIGAGAEIAAVAVTSAGRCQRVVQDISGVRRHSGEQWLGSGLVWRRVRMPEPTPTSRQQSSCVAQNASRLRLLVRSGCWGERGLAHSTFLRRQRAHRRRLCVGFGESIPKPCAPLWHSYWHCILPWSGEDSVCWLE